MEYQSPMNSLVRETLHKTSPDTREKELQEQGSALCSSMVLGGISQLAI